MKKNLYKIYILVISRHEHEFTEEVVVVSRRITEAGDICPI